jgi:HMGL-like
MDERTKYTLRYYVALAKQLEKLGTHILGIKDMAGLLKPYAAKTLVRALRQEIGIPIHFHTHDTAGGQVASYLMAAEEGVDVVDCAFSSMAGTIANLVAALKPGRSCGTTFLDSAGPASTVSSHSSTPPNGPLKPGRSVPPGSPGQAPLRSQNGGRSQWVPL